MVVEAPDERIGAETVEDRRVPAVGPDQKISVASQVGRETADGLPEPPGFVDVIAHGGEYRPDPDIGRIAARALGTPPYGRCRSRQRIVGEERVEHDRVHAGSGEFQ
jgi:hypothetical protein